MQLPFAVRQFDPRSLARSLAERYLFAPRSDFQPNLHATFHGGILQPPAVWEIPAMTVLPFVRSPLGYELVRPERAAMRTILPLAIALVLSWLGVKFIAAPQGGLDYFALFLVASFCMNLGLFLTRLFGNRYRQPHSCDAGYAFLTRYTALPLFLTEVVVMPGIIAGLGYVALRFSLDLGWWLIASGASLAILAITEASRRHHGRRLSNDGVIQSEMSADQYEGYARGGTQRASRDNIVDFANFR